MFRTTETHNKRQIVSFNAFLWHFRLGHINLNRIGRLDKSGLLSQLEDNSLSPCDPCLEGIQSQLSAPNTHQQNGVSKRRNRTLLDMVRSMMSCAQLPDFF